MEPLNERILSAAKEIAREQGLAHLNIREVAHRSGVAVGTLYNYFANKSDLTIAVVQDFWQEALPLIRPDTSVGLLCSLEELYHSFQLYLTHFEENWLEQLSALSAQEKKQGLRQMSQYIMGVQKQILQLIQSDRNLPDSKFVLFTREELAALICENLFTSLQQGTGSFPSFLALLRQSLY